MRIVIVTHAREVRSFDSMYTLGLIAAEWRKSGHEVEVIRGVTRRVPADVAIAHVDLTRTPPEYSEFLREYPVVINRKIVDIAKRTIGANAIAHGDRVSGPVIIKTDLNCRGASEVLLLGGNSRSDPWRFVPRFVANRFRWRLAPLTTYRIVPSVDAVPDNVWGDERLVVERFLPERDPERDGYLLRKCLFLGACTVNVVFRSTVPIIYGATATDPREVEAPRELLDYRSLVGLDYGRIDYGIVDGRLVVYDVNKTPTYHGPSPRMLDAGRRLAPAIADYV